MRELEMSVDLEHLRALAETLTGEPADSLRQAAREIELLRKQLIEAHAGNADSERLNWLSSQVLDDYCRPTHRAYFKLPRILATKDGVIATTLREAIDLVRKYRYPEL
ncbi:hypothetical protein [Trinickia mobilis]|uniref:hypothetical protein n=1 Tax=Trinickia mobilis TaxID=2816356 RepID=UPI001A903B72|nr:hypothetical protein [Trinickia mobilis]